jgi:hypothetical protein
MGSAAGFVSPAWAAPAPVAVELGSGTSAAESLLAWLGDLSPDVQRDLARDHPGIVSKEMDRQLAFLLALEDPRPARRRAARSVLEGLSTVRPDALLELLNLALVWLPPALAEPLVDQFLSGLDPGKLADDALVAYLNPAAARKSYRLQQALLDRVLARLPSGRRQTLAERCRTGGLSPRARWLREWLACVPI